MTPYYEHGGITIYHGDARDLLPALRSRDVAHVITDPPYSARTHAGHDASAAGHNGIGHDGATRHVLHYDAWTADDVAEYVRHACAVATGWIVTMTDHVLAHELDARLASERYVFAPLPYVAPGSRVRLAGDGPSSWTVWIVVARTAALARWGTLPGAYLAGAGWRDRAYMGGKPLALMRALVADYSKPGELILDPYMGGGTTLAAAKQLGRRAIGIDVNETACALAAERLAQGVLDFAGVDAHHQQDLL